MTKKHFIALADAIRSANYLPNGIPNNHEDRFTVDQIERLADCCAAQNPNFNRQRWLDYVDGKCGPNGGAR